MDEQQLLEPSCRVALAALLHDLGKFAERAGLALPNLDGNKMIYCPSWNSRHSHIHAAYSGMAVDAIEGNIPDIKKGAMAPFSSWSDPAPTDDSLINGAAMHHKPETPLQRIIATADRLASGFERAEFEEYNRAEEGQEKGRVNHLRARMWPILERVYCQKDPEHRFPLRAMAPETIFPKKDVVPQDDAKAREEYKSLWDEFVAGLQKIPKPKPHRAALPLWLDHFDSLLLTFTHAIPSATATKKPWVGFLAIPADVSLYDHSKAVAALAVALWRYHQALGSVEQTFSEKEWKWHENRDAEFLLIQGDFYGIQEFIFAGGETAKKAAKLLRGRSFAVSLLTEMAALKVLEAFELPATSQIINAAGKFQIVAPNLPDAMERVAKVRRELDEWFLQHTFGQNGIGLATTVAHWRDFTKTGYFKLMQRLIQDLECRKRQRFDLCSETDARIFAAEYNEQGVCDFCGKAPAVAPAVIQSDDEKKCLLCADQVQIGEKLVKLERLLITRTEVSSEKTLKSDYFGFRVSFTGGEEESGKFGSLVRGEALLRTWDFSLPNAKDGAAPLWNGYARRAINGYVPREANGDLKDFEAIAQTGIRDIDGERRGVAALGILKGDVDNLGMIFQKGLEQPTFARVAAMSRQLNAFFAIWLPWQCSREEFSNTYTVFAGGDDFFLIGPWLEQIRLAEFMRDEFQRYTANEKMHFSAGLAMTKPGLPVPALADLAEDALAKAKEHPGKNAVTCWNRTVGWKTFGEMRKAEEELAGLVKWLKQEHDVEMSTAYLYGLLHLCDKAASPKPEDAIWRSWFVYRSWRFVVDKLRNAKNDQERQKIYQEEFAEKIGKMITEYKGNYKIALFTRLYQRRKAS